MFGRPSRIQGQVSVELVIMVSVALALLMVAFLVNDHMASSWENQKQKLEAGFAADRLALAVGRAVSGGDGATVHFFNHVMPDVNNMSMDGNRSVSASTVSGVSSSVPLVANASAPFGIPINQEILVRNTNGTITIEVA
jgi:hypothetical protein